MYNRSEASRVGGITNSFNIEGNGIQDFRNSTIIVIMNEGLEVGL